MLEIIHSVHDAELVQVAPYDVLYVSEQLSNSITRFADVEEVPKGYSLTFRMGCFLVVSGLFSNHTTVKVLHFACEKGEGVIISPPAKEWARLQMALKFAKVPKTRIPGGIQYAVIYPYQLLVRGFYKNEPQDTCWIVHRNRIQSYLDNFPARQTSGRTRSIWIDRVGWMEKFPQVAIKTVFEDPTDLPPPLFYRSGSDQPESTNRNIFRINFDTGTFQIQEIINQTTQSTLEELPYFEKGILSTLRPGQDLPHSLRPRRPQR